MGPSVNTPPTIDITPLRSAPSSDGHKELGSTIHSACVDVGFFVATGHGIDDEMAALFAVARDFFALPEEVKEGVDRIDRYGFVPHRRWAIDTSRKLADTEFIDIGLHDEVELAVLAGFGTAVRDYQREALDVARMILRTLATALGTEAEFFAARMTDPQCRLRLLHYPEAVPGADGAVPVPNQPHTDYGAITLLATDGVPGLEVKPIGSDWTPVTAPADSLIVNLGDMLARWSNDVYRSTPHRVVGPPSGDRLSIPFFVNPDPGTSIECIPSCVDDAHPCGYVPVTAGDFLASRIDGSIEPYVDPLEGPTRRVTA